MSIYDDINWDLMRQQKQWLKEQDSSLAQGLVVLIEQIQSLACTDGNQEPVKVYGVRRRTYDLKLQVKVPATVIETAELDEAIYNIVEHCTAREAIETGLDAWLAGASVESFYVDNPVEEWDDPVALNLIDSVGIVEYNRLIRKHFEDSTVAIVNGYPIRPVGSRWGRIYMIDGAGKGFLKLEESKAYAATLPPREEA